MDSPGIRSDDCSTWLWSSLFEAKGFLGLVESDTKRAPILRVYADTCLKHVQATLEKRRKEDLGGVPFTKMELVAQPKPAHNSALQSSLPQTQSIGRFFASGCPKNILETRGVPNGRGSTPTGSHFGVGAPPSLEPILVGMGMFTGGTIWVLTHSPNLCLENPPFRSGHRQDAAPPTAPDFLRLGHGAGAVHYGQHPWPTAALVLCWRWNISW